MSRTAWYMIAFIATVGIISFEEAKHCKQLPWPPHLVGAGIVFTLLGLFSFFSDELAGVMAIGFVLATYLNHGFVGNCSHNELGTTQPGTAQAEPAAYNVITGQYGVTEA